MILWTPSRPTVGVSCGSGSVAAADKRKYITFRYFHLVMSFLSVLTSTPQSYFALVLLERWSGRLKSITCRKFHRN